MAFEIDHVGAVVQFAVTSDKWSADAALFAASPDGRRITVTPAHMGAAGPSYKIGAITKRYAGPPLPEEPEARQRVRGRPPRSAPRCGRCDERDAWSRSGDASSASAELFLIDLLAEHGKIVSEQELISMSFAFEFSREALATLKEE